MKNESKKATDSNRKAQIPNTGTPRAGKPITVKVGNVAVRIYRGQTRGYPYFQVADFSSGKRKFVTFSDEQEARDKAQEIALKLNSGQVDVLTMTSADRASFVRASELLQPTGIPVELAAAEFAEAKLKLGGRSLVEAVNFFVRHNPASLPRKTVAEVVAELVAAKTADGVSGVYLKDLNFRLGKFQEAFCGQISDVTAADINVFLRGLKCAGRGRNNYRGSIGTLMKFAGASGYVTKNQIDFATVARAKEEQNEIEIFTSQVISRLLTAAQLDPADLSPGWNKRYATGPGLLPFLVLGAFAGLRTAEIERQVWEDINVERGFIRVTAAKGNTAQKRLVPIAPNLKKWLALCRKDAGPVCEIARTAEALTRLAGRAGVKWKHNALRHSYASYRMAEIKNAAQVSLELGNTPKMVFRHYRELVTEEEAKVWFAIGPEKPANVVAMATKAA